MLCIVETEFPMWLLAIERFGLGYAMIVFVGAVVWKLLPAFIKMLGAWRKQSEEAAKVMPCIMDFTKALTKAAPDALEGIRDLAQNAERIADHVVGMDRSEDGPRRARLRRGGDSPDPVHETSDGA